MKDEKLDYYISRNTYTKGIRLVRRYYGIVAKNPKYTTFLQKCIDK